MEVTRRQFLKGSSATVVGGLGLSAIGIDVKSAEATANDMKRMNKLRSPTQT